MWTGRCGSFPLVVAGASLPPLPHGDAGSGARGTPGVRHPGRAPVRPDPDPPRGAAPTVAEPVMRRAVAAHNFATAYAILQHDHGVAF